MITRDYKIEFEERYDDKDYKTVTFYYVSDTSLLKELVGDKYPEASGMTISVECPMDHFEAKEASVQISPYKECEDVITDYDWTDINLQYEEVEALIYMALQDMDKNDFEEENNDVFLWNELKKHRGHKVSIVSYGDWDNPVDICLECEGCT